MNIMKNLDYMMEKVYSVQKQQQGLLVKDLRLMMMLAEWWENVIDTIYDENYLPTFLHLT